VQQADAQKLLYDAAKQAAQGTPTPADDLAVAATFCVKKSPEPRHFEVCVGRIEGELAFRRISQARELRAPAVVQSPAWCAGAPIMKSGGKSYSG